MAPKIKVALDKTAHFLHEQIATTERFGGALTYLLMKPLPDGRVMVQSQEQRSSIVMTCTSLNTLDIKSPARLDNLGYLKSVIDLVSKSASRGSPAVLDFETKVASDQKTEVIKTISFKAGNGTVYEYKASDPFLSKTKASQSRVTEWPVELHFTPDGVELFDDAARTHMAGALKADNQEYFRISVTGGDIIARFESRAGKIDHVLGSTKSQFQGESAYNIPQFRSVLSAMGNNGGILRIAEPAISMETETNVGLYTFVLAKKILR